MAAPSEPAGTGNMVNGDFSFLFMNPKFSDRVLKIVIEEANPESAPVLATGRPVCQSPKEESTEKETAATPEGERTPLKEVHANETRLDTLQTWRTKRAKISEGETEKDVEAERSKEDQGGRVKRIPVNSAILGGRSPYFLKLFGGDFAEGSIATEVEIFLAPEDENAFSGILEFLYSGKLSDAELPDIVSVLQHLRLADRFDSKECITALSERLCSLAEEMDTAKATVLISSPVTLRRFSKVNITVQAARKYLVNTFGPMMGKAELPKEFLELPECALVALLDSTDLDIAHEDAAFVATYAWLEENVKSREELLCTLAAQVLPRLRLHYLSPMRASRLCQLLRELLLADSSSFLTNENTSSVQSFIAARSIVEGREASKAMASMYAAVSVGHYVALLVERAILPPELLEVFCNPQSVAVKPRLGYRPPDATLLLDLSLEECKSWHKFSRLRSRSHCLAGRWFSFEATYDHRATSPTVGTFVYWDASPKGRVEPPKIRYTISTFTGSSNRSLTSVHEFTEHGGKGFADFFSKPWTELLKEHETYFPEGAMCLKAELWALP